MTRFAVLLAACLAIAACAGTTAPTASLGPSSSPGPTAPATPTPSPTPSGTPAPAGRTFIAADFTKHGGCGDVYIWAATEDDTYAVVVNWQDAATEAVDMGSFSETITLPAAAVTVTLQTGQNLSTGLCNDVIMPDYRVDGEAPAVGGTVSLDVQPNGDQVFDTADADLTLRDVVFDIVFGTEVEQWRIESLDLEDVLVGWLAG